jgi:hypothetical protein
MSGQGFPRIVWIYLLIRYITYISSLDGLMMVSVPAVGPSVRGLEPGQGDGSLRAIKIRNTSSFRGEVKPSAPRRKIMRHVKMTSKYEQILRRLN